MAKQDLSPPSGRKAVATKRKTKSAITNAKKKKAPPQPTIYVCPQTNQNVYIGKATLKDLKAKTTYANTSNKKRLWILPSPQVRNELYVEAAHAIAKIEQALLPSFGGRSWEVTCKLTEPQWSGQVLFRAWKGQMELAALPHLIERIPVPPTWPGRRSQPDEYEEGEDVDEKGLLQREVSSLSSVAWDLRDSYPVPTVTLKWQSPERKIFNSRKAAWEHATAMAAREVEINKCLKGVGASGKLLKPFIPSAATALKVGKLRFERDGLWVVGQELAWQEERPEELLVEQAEEEERRTSIVPKSGLALYLMRKREEYREAHEGCNTLKQAETELRKIWKTLPRAEQKEWNRQAGAGDDESSESEGETEFPETLKDEIKIAEPEPEPEPLKLSMTPAAFYVKSRRHAYQEERKAQKWSISLGECDIHLRQLWKTLEDSVKREWEQKLIAHETKRAEEKAQAEREAREAERAKENAEREALRAEETKLPVGLEVDKDEGENRAKAAGSLVSDVVIVPVDAKRNAAPCIDVAHQVIKTTESPPSQEFGARDSVATAGCGKDSKSTLEDRVETTVPVVISLPSQHAGEESRLIEENSAMETLNANVGKYEVKAENLFECGPVMKVQATEETANDTNEDSSKCRTDIEHEEEKKEDEGSPKPSEAPSSKDEIAAVGLPLVACSTHQHFGAENDVSRPTFVPSSERIKKRVKSAPRKVPSTQMTQRWCMNQQQIDLCFAACMDHYETVMRTVKARDLHRELQDGFDVFRERGFGRYDMELPAFDDPEVFEFLTDLHKAPWMPVVKAILGDDAILIHKGCFLSMPGAAPQEYHQDGVHLTTQTQRPCHAINVFVPLVDLTNQNGPTEFCLGSHILGLEGYDRDFVETPKPKAGTPVIFDYRLGHRGLGNNTSRSCRPVVYCTYARASQGKEFRDLVNFSRKRYHKIGELSRKPMSREERRNKRKRDAFKKEEEELKRCMEESARQTPSESEADGKSESNADEPNYEAMEARKVVSIGIPEVATYELEHDPKSKTIHNLDGNAKESKDDAMEASEATSMNVPEVKKYELQQESISTTIQNLIASANSSK